jgi:hypothetical protein
MEDALVGVPSRDMTEPAKIAQTGVTATARRNQR